MSKGLTPRPPRPTTERPSSGEGETPERATRVECYSGSECAETPRAVWRGGQRLAVAEVEARWRFPGGKGFRVRMVEGPVFNLTYAEAGDEWQVQQA